MNLGVPFLCAPESTVEEMVAWEAAVLARDSILGLIGELESKFMAPDLKKQLFTTKKKADEKLASLEVALHQRKCLQLRLRRVTIGRIATIMMFEAASLSLKDLAYASPSSLTAGQRHWLSSATRKSSRMALTDISLLRH